MIAFMRGDNWGEKVMDGGLEAMEPFWSEDILAGKILDVARNRTKEGRHVWNPQADWHVKAAKFAMHVGEAFTPGTLNNLERIRQGLVNPSDPFGKKYNPGVEALALFTGQRVLEVDVPRSLSFKTKDFIRERREARALLSATVRIRGDVSEADIKEAYRTAEKAERALFDTMHETTQAARRLGITEDQILAILDDAGLSKIDAGRIFMGDYTPYAPSIQSLRSITKSMMLQSKTPEGILGEMGERVEDLGEVIEESGRNQ